MAITQVTISIDTTNAAFCEPMSQEPDDDYALAEVETIIAGVLRYGIRHNLPLRDTNGNTVGVVTITREEE